MIRQPLLLSALLIPTLLIGCKRSDSAPVSAVVLPVKMAAQLQPIAQIAPGRTVHVAVDTLGNTFYTLETDKGTDGVVVISENGIPRATQLTSANILAAMGESVGGNGTIQDLIAAPEGGLYFYFIGGKGRRMRACVGQFNLRGETISILFDTPVLSALSGMGDSLDLARGTLARAGRRMNLLLRHTDGWALLGFDAKRPGPGIQLVLERWLQKIQIDDQDIDLANDRYELSSGPDDTLLLVDSRSGILWQIDPFGHAKLRLFLTGLPRELSRPVVSGPRHLVLFAADSEPIEADLSQTLTRRLPQVAYPALLKIDDQEITAIGRDDLRAPGGFPTYAVRIHQVVAAPDGSLVGYDQASGQMMRIRLVEK